MGQKILGPLKRILERAPVCDFQGLMHRDINIYNQTDKHMFLNNNILKTGKINKMNVSTTLTRQREEN
jgi:hypothetical protein